MLKSIQVAVERNPAGPEINETIKLFREAVEAGAGEGAGEGGGAGGGVVAGEGAAEAVAPSAAAASPRAEGADARGAMEEEGAKLEGTAEGKVDLGQEGGEGFSAGESKDAPAQGAEAGPKEAVSEDEEGADGPGASVTGSAADDFLAESAIAPADDHHYGPIEVAAIPVSALYDDEDIEDVQEQEQEEESWEPMRINEDFTDNPMYPFSVSEPAQICFALYQPDRRWSVGRLGEDPRSVVASEFASRGQRLAACMQYPHALGFLVVRLFGSKVPTMTPPPPPPQHQRNLNF